MRARTWMLMAAVVAAGCQSVYFDTMEKFGVHKRDILVDRVEEARDSQEEASEQFASALDKFRSVVEVKGGSLEQKYDALNAELQRSESRAKAVTDRIDAVEDVAEALFKEWEQELTSYSSAELRRSSEQQLRTTRTRYEGLMRAMQQAESRLEPVLKPLRDQVLYLKHNLNAQAIGALQNELTTIEDDVERLVAEMQRSIAEADAFIREMEQQK